MSNIDFDNGFLLGLAVAYKKAAATVGFGDFLIFPLADGVLQSAHMHNITDAVQIIIRDV